MTDQTGAAQDPGSANEARRAFLARAGNVAITAPAATLLLAASTRPSEAQVVTSGGVDPAGGGTAAVAIFAAAAAGWHNWRRPPKA